MNTVSDYKGVSIALRGFGAMMTVFFIGWWVMTVSDSALIQAGGILAPLRWEPYSKHVELMLYTIYIVWGIFMWRAGSDPKKYASFIDFTIWANAAHALLMVVQALMVDHLTHHLMSDIPFLVVVVCVLAWLRPKELANY
jgi:hypothetical protein